MPRQRHRPIRSTDVPAELYAEVRELARHEELAVGDLLARLLSMGLTRYRALRKYAEKRRNSSVKRARSAVD